MDPMPTLLVLFLASTPPTPSSTATRGAPQAVPVNLWRLGLDGYGPVRIGMTLAEASKASGKNMDPGPLDEDEKNCFYGRAIDDPVLSQVGFMFVKGRLTRIDIFRGEVATSEGVRVGTDEVALLKLYPSAKVTDHPYTDGHYVASISGKVGVVFETDGKVVTKFRVGDADAIQWWEGCQ